MEREGTNKVEREEIRGVDEKGKINIEQWMKWR